MAYIYYIKHKETGKTYIGQTVQPLEQRVRQHLAGSTEVDRALQSLGLYSFDYGVIEQCKSEELDEKEIYYIAKYDTYYNGYNNQLGGRKTGQNKYDNIIVNGVTCVELNKSFDSLVNAARYLRGDVTLTTYDLKGCIYSISLAARNGGVYKGYHWVINNK